ncbi:MAG: hypothetical protein HY674_09520 [Chloroflexi bacterium]|nr:hypothetical protein [Chloroflexota bacterium]
MTIHDPRLQGDAAKPDPLSPPNWVVLQTIVGDGSIVTVTDSATNAPQRFYRVRVEQP